MLGDVAEDVGKASVENVWCVDCRFGAASVHQGMLCMQ
jgi:hypothetical protein